MQVSPRYEGPTIISIAGEPGDQLEPLTRQRQRFAELLAGLDADDWNRQSRCADWTVQDVVAHLVGVNAFWRASVQAGLAGTPTRVLTGFDPATTPELLVAPMRELGPAEVLDQFVASNDALLGLLADLDDAGWETAAESPAGHVPIRLIAAHGLWDSWVHERDVAFPLGITPAVEADEVASALRYAAALSPALALTNGHSLAGRYAVEADDPALRCVLEVGESVRLRDEDATANAPCLRGDAAELVEALSIRGPLPPSAPPEWKCLLEGLATAFTAV